MKREQLQARCDPDTVEAVKEFQEQKDITKSEAVRRLIRAGLEAKSEEYDGPIRQAGLGNGAVLFLALLLVLGIVLQVITLIGGAL
jgi:hypothetical protein